MGWDLRELRRRLTLYAAGAVFASILLILALVYLAVAIQEAFLLILIPALASLATAASLLLIIALTFLGIVLFLRHRARIRARNRPEPRDLVGEGLDLARRNPLTSVAVAFAAGFAASKSPAAEAAVTAALKQAMGEMKV